MFNVYPAPSSGMKSTSSIVTGRSTNGSDAAVISATYLNSDVAKTALSGAVTAGVLKTLLSITGAGRLDIAGVSSVDVTSRTLRMKVTLDGIVAFDCTSAANTTVDLGVLAAGTLSSSTNKVVGLEHAYFAKSCVIEFTSSLTETDKQKTFLRYQLH